MYDANWNRWIAASVGDYFKTASDEIGIPFLYEGVDEREAETIRAGSHLELRFHGPESNELSNGYFRLQCEINLLITELMGDSGSNSYDLFQWAGRLAYKMQQGIPVYAFGTGPDDDDSLVECLRLDTSLTKNLASFYFGQVSPEYRVRQAAVDGRFHMYLHQKNS